MIVNANVTWFLATALCNDFIKLSDTSLTGYVTCKNGRQSVYGDVQVANDSVLLRQILLKYICLKVQSSSTTPSPLPLFKLTTRNHSDEDLIYRIDCISDCMDLYIECSPSPFRLDPSGDIRVSFQSEWSALCIVPDLTRTLAAKFCNLFGLPSTNTTVFAGSQRNHMKARQLSVVDCPVGQDCSDIMSIATNHSVLLNEDGCSGSTLAAIQCNRLDLKFQILEKSTDHHGLVQLFDGDGWVNLCPRGIGLNETQVLCRSLGYPSSDANYHQRAVRKLPACLHLGNLFCEGNESDVSDCIGYDTFGRYNSRYALNISCSNATEGKVRVTGGYDGISGRLEVYHDNRWGYVCKNRFREDEARAACNSIARGQFSQGSVVQNPPPVLPTSTVDGIWMDEVNCLRGQGTFENCTHGLWGEHSCRYANEIVFVQCSDPRRFRLVGHIGEYSRLEVFHNGQWGSVCSTSFHKEEARAVCRTLALPSGTPRWCTTSQPVQVSSPIWLDAIYCDTYSPNVDACRGWAWGLISADNCSSRSDVTISCQDPEARSIEYRLWRSGSAGDVGLVELKYDGQWGKVCAHHQGHQLAAVACRSLGLPPLNAQIVKTSDFAASSSKVWLTDVKCNGTERNLMQCSFPAFGPQSNICPPSDSLNVACGSRPASSLPYPVRLRGGDDRTGRVEIQLHGVWGAVCRRTLEIQTVQVICRQLGYPVSSATFKVNKKYGPSRGEVIWLDEISCSGEETDISQCTGLVLGQLSCTHRDDLAIQCGSPDNPQQNSPNPGAVAGGVAAGVVFLCLVTMLVVYVVRRNRKSPPADPTATQSQHSDQTAYLHPSAPEAPARVVDEPDYTVGPPPYAIPLSPVGRQSVHEDPPPSYQELYPEEGPKPVFAVDTV